ncbi:MAG TPA: hypothetical protein VFL71_07730 [Actinomycetes bacterium]|nr:hypothetical protein [Actinomycetes bacterium]
MAQRDQANAPQRLPLRLIVPAGGALVAVLLKQNMNYGVLGANARDVVKRLVD